MIVPLKMENEAVELAESFVNTAVGIVNALAELSACIRKAPFKDVESHIHFLESLIDLLESLIDLFESLINPIESLIYFIETSVHSFKSNVHVYREFLQSLSDFINFFLHTCLC